MVRDRLNNLFEIQCGEEACVEEDYAGRIIMVLLSRSNSCSRYWIGKMRGSVWSCVQLHKLSSVNSCFWGSPENMVWVCKECYMAYAQCSQLFNNQPLLGRTTPDWFTVRGREDLMSLGSFHCCGPVTKLQSGQLQNAVAVLSLSKGCASQPVSLGFYLKPLLTGTGRISVFEEDVSWEMKNPMPQ